jgi:hypothetical protein
MATLAMALVALAWTAPAAAQEGTRTFASGSVLQRLRNARLSAQDFLKQHRERLLGLGDASVRQLVSRLERAVTSARRARGARAKRSLQEITDLQGQLQRKVQAPAGAGEVAPAASGSQTAVAVADEGPAAPAPPSGILAEGVRIDVDLPALVAYGNASQADKSGNPEEAAKAWRALASIPGKNPYRRDAAARARAWEEYGKKLAGFAGQAQADYNKLEVVGKLQVFTNEQKASLVKQFMRKYRSLPSWVAKARDLLAQWEGPASSEQPAPKEPAASEAQGRPTEQADAGVTEGGWIRDKDGRWRRADKGGGKAGSEDRKGRIEERNRRGDEDRDRRERDVDERDDRDDEDRRRESDERRGKD